MNKTLDRIPATFLRERLAEMTQHCQPAVITGLFCGQPIEQITNPQRAREMLGAMKVSISPNYVDTNLERIRYFVRGVPSPPKPGKPTATFAEYLDLIARNPDTRSLVSEEPTPANLLIDIDLGVIGIDTVIGGYVSPFAPASVTTAHSLIFAANRGNASDLHTDWDGRDVILFQGFGRKRVILFPPEAASRLHPIDIYSTVRLADMGEADRHAFLTYAGGVEHTLLPGEAIFMPAFTWHHVDYLDPAMSVSFRFGGVEDPNALALIRTIHRDQHVQNIIAGTRNPARAEDCRAAARRLRTASEQTYPSTHAKYRAMRALAAECHYATLTPDTRPYLGGIIEAEDFLSGALCGYYSRPPDGSVLHRRAWLAQEKVRDLLRRWGRKIAFWA